MRKLGVEDNKGFVQSDVNGTKASLLIVSLKCCRDGLRQIFGMMEGARVVKSGSLGKHGSSTLPPFSIVCKILCTDENPKDRWAFYNNG